MDFKSTLSLNADLLRETFLAAVAGWPTGEIVVRVRWSRGADFSGSCVYATHRIHVNLGRHVRYPYQMQTYCARPRKAWGRTYKPISVLELADGYQVCLFIFLHEFYHWLVKKAGRNVSQKESMCDRFATRVLVDDYGCQLRDSGGRALPREHWDFQNLDGFVAAAKRPPRPARAARPRAARQARPLLDGGQFLLFR
jgi:hypothetical protein